MSPPELIAGDSSVAAMALLDLKKSGITKPDDIKKLRLTAVSADEMARLTGSDFWRVPAYGFPYFKLDGVTPMTWTTQGGKNLPFVRFKLLEPVKGKRGKQIKYYQPKGSGTHLYYPPVTEMPWAEIARDVKIKIIITEGEKKAIISTLMLGPTIGLCGVRSYNTVDWDGFVTKDRAGDVVFDADAAPEDGDVE